jgi:Holliday junction resolvase RusA-like endonuclease
MSNNEISLEDYKKLTSKGILKTDKAGRTKTQAAVIDLANFLKKEQQKTDVLFKAEYDYKTDQTYYPITIILPGEPRAKQSVRYGASRYFTHGEHKCPWCNQMTEHQKGDVVVFGNGTTHLVDCIIKSYPDSELEQIKKGYIACIQAQLPTEFKMYTEECHVISMDLVFAPLKSFSQKMMKAIESGAIVYKNTRGDVDNYQKLIWDSLNGLVYKDDSIIVSLNGVRKFFGLEPHVRIMLKGY